MGGLHSCDRSGSLRSDACGKAGYGQGHLSRRSMSMIAEQAVERGPTRRSTSTFQWAPKGRMPGLVSSHSLNDAACMVDGIEASCSKQQSSRHEMYDALKRKFFHSRKFYKNRKEKRVNKDHAKAFRDLVASWKTRDLHCLLIEYEAGIALRDLTLKAERARGPSSSLVSDLTVLFETECVYGEDKNELLRIADTTDALVQYQSVFFKAHASLLASRCICFRRMLARVDSDEAGTSSGCSVDGSYKLFPVSLSPDLAGVISIDLFHMLLRYVYTGDLQALHDAVLRVVNKQDSIDFLLRIKDEFGVSHPLDYDISSMLSSDSLYDVLLDFSTPSNQSYGYSFSR